MRFGPKDKPRVTVRARKFSVRARLTLAFLVVITISWLLGFLTLRFLMEEDVKRFNREMATRDAQTRIRLGPLGRLLYGPPGPPPDGAIGSAPGWRQGPGPDAFQGPAGPNAPGSPNIADGPRGPGPRGPHGRRPGLPPPIYRNLLVEAVTSVILAMLAGWWLSRRFTRPLAALADGARAFHERKFAHRIRVAGNDEFADVAATMNEMAERVGEQITELEKDAHRRQQVLADVAHELRSPVTTLEAMAVAMRDGVADDAGRRAEAIAYMIDSAGRMRRLVNDLLEIARLDLHELPMVCAPVDLRELAEDAVYTHRGAAKAADIELKPVEDGDPVVVEADRLRIAQVLDNLVENAIAYAGEGAGIRVEVTAEPPGLVVEDTGAGIAARHLPFIFDPFYRADAARTPGENHSGLGLRIARALVEAHGGTLTLESEEGAGTRSIISFPDGSSSVPDAELKEERENPPAPTAALP